jgi:glycerophosphoryl diester phosphodiesterase
MPAAPIIIAHRGASGYLPEHTLEAKALAFGLGADYLEQDVVATRDSELVVLHDLHLDDVTDVAERFPGRHRQDGRHYAIDFDLVELQQLSVSERRRQGSREARFPERFPTEIAIFRIATLEQELALIAGLNRSMRRTVGIYPEIKHPQWHRAHGVDLSRLLIGKLRAHGYEGADAAAFVQCFDAAELRRVRYELDCNLKLVQLVGAEPEYAPLLSGEGLAGVARYADALGPSYAQLLAFDESNGAIRPSELAREAQRAGLALHPYTFRRDELPPHATSLDELLSLFITQIGIDGLFCDQPDIAVAVRDRAARRS